ncbi:MAG: four helix bundle protein [Gemmatimonadales bacterium]
MIVAKRRRGEEARFLDTARGSLAEVQTALEMARELEYLEREESLRLESLAAETARTLWGLLRSVGTRIS